VVVFLVLFYPGHNVFFAAYAESYFLALTVVALLLRQREHVAAASLIAGLASLVRIMGSFLVVALFAEQVFYCIRDRKLHWQRLLAASLGLCMVAGWQLALSLNGTNSVAAGHEWVRELVANHVPPGTNPKLWVLQYVSFSWHAEPIAFWVSIVAIGYCGWKRRYAEMFYIVAFYLSLAVYIYRPFPWTRYVSVLFPIQLMIADVLKNKPRLTCAVLMISAATCCYIQRDLFRDYYGEP
jgi:hypothetical protein